MKKNKTIAVCVIVSMLTLAILTGCAGTKTGTSDNPSTKVAELRVGGSTTSTWIYGFLVALSEVVNNNQSEARLNVQATSGSAAHYAMLQQGEIELGSGSTFTDLQAYKGEGAFPQKYDKFYSLLPATISYCQVVVLKNSGINQLKDLENKKVGIGGRGSPTSQMAEGILKSLGINAQPITSTHQEMIEMIKDGRVDALVYFGGVPYSGILDVASSNDIKLVPFTPEEQNITCREIPSLSPVIIEGGGYTFMDGEVPTVKSLQDVLIRSDISEDLAYKITKTAWENWGDLVSVVPSAGTVSLENAENFVVPIHPGAIKYYEEQGIKIPDNLKP